MDNKIAKILSIDGFKYEVVNEADWDSANIKNKPFGTYSGTFLAKDVTSSFRQKLSNSEKLTTNSISADVPFIEDCQYIVSFNGIKQLLSLNKIDDNVYESYELNDYYKIQLKITIPSTNENQQQLSIYFSNDLNALGDINITVFRADNIGSDTYDCNIYQSLNIYEKHEIDNKISTDYDDLTYKHFGLIKYSKDFTFEEKTDQVSNLSGAVNKDNHKIYKFTPISIDIQPNKQYAVFYKDKFAGVFNTYINTGSDRTSLYSDGYSAADADKESYSFMFYRDDTNSPGNAFGSTSIYYIDINDESPNYVYLKYIHIIEIDRNGDKSIELKLDNKWLNPYDIHMDEKISDKLFGNIIEQVYTKDILAQDNIKFQQNSAKHLMGTITFNNKPEVGDLVELIINEKTYGIGKCVSGGYVLNGAATEAYEFSWENGWKLEIKSSNSQIWIPLSNELTNNTVSVIINKCTNPTDQLSIKKLAEEYIELPDYLQALIDNKPFKVTNDGLTLDANYVDNNVCEDDQISDKPFGKISKSETTYKVVGKFSQAGASTFILSNNNFNMNIGDVVSFYINGVFKGTAECKTAPNFGNMYTVNVGSSPATPLTDWCIAGTPNGGPYSIYVNNINTTNEYEVEIRINETTEIKKINTSYVDYLNYIEDPAIADKPFGQIERYYDTIKYETVYDEEVSITTPEDEETVQKQVSLIITSHTFTAGEQAELFVDGESWGIGTKDELAPFILSHNNTAMEAATEGWKYFQNGEGSMLYIANVSLGTHHITIKKVDIIQESEIYTKKLDQKYIDIPEARNIGANIINTLSIPTDKEKCFININVGGELRIDGELSIGQDIHLFINNTGDEEITITIPEEYKSNGKTELIVEEGCFAKLYVACDGENTYVFHHVCFI